MNTKLISTPRHVYAFGKKILCALVLLMSINSEVSAQWVKVGSGVNQANTSTSYPTPFGNTNKGQRAEYLYYADDLRNAGIKAGWIDSLGFKILNLNSTYVYANLNFYVGTLDSASIMAAFGGWGFPATTAAWMSLPVRYSSPALSYLPTLGWNNFGFSAPIYWNGKDNIVVGTCFGGGTNSTNASVQWDSAYAISTGAKNVSRTYATSTATDIPNVCSSLWPGPDAGNQKYRPNLGLFTHRSVCAGKPSAGKAVANADSTGGYTYCILDDSFALSLIHNSLDSGLSFQWQLATSASGPWTNLGTASTSRININTKGQTVATYYRCVVTCLMSGLSDTSIKILVAMAPPYRCDCSSASLDNTEEKILSVSLNTMFNSTPCGLSAGYYLDSTKMVGATSLEPGTTYPLTVRVGSCDTNNRSRAIKVFIDFNQNATYEISEMVYANTYSSAQPNPQNASGTFTVPTTAKVGRTTMRIVYEQTTSLSSVIPCGTYAHGETQDYAVRILPFGKPTVTGRLEVCQYDSVVMNASSTADTPVVFNWTGPGGFTGIGPKITFTNADPSLSGVYHVTATSGGITSSAQDVTVIVHPKPPVPNVLNQNMCQYESPSKLITDGTNVIWYNVPVGGYGDTVAPTIVTYTPNTTTFYLTQTVAGCTSDRGMVKVNVLLKPTPPVVVSPATYCQLQTPDLVAKGTDLKWYLDSVGGVASTISPIPPTGFPALVTYYVTQTINGCESDRARITVYVYEQPNGIIIQTKKYVCQYDTASFIYYGSAPASYSYKWWSEDGYPLISGGGQGPVTYRFNTAGDHIISLYVNNGDCATSKISDTISVRPAPTATIDPTLNACVDVPVSITMDTATPYITNYNWNWDGGTLDYEAQDGGPYGVKWSTAGQKILTLVVTARTCNSLPIYDTLYVNNRPDVAIHANQIAGIGGVDTIAYTGSVCSRDTVYFYTRYDSTFSYKWSPSYYFNVKNTYQASDRMYVPGFVRVDVENKYGCLNADSIYVNVQPCCDLYMPTAFTPNGDNNNDLFRPVTIGRQEIITFRIVNRWGNEVFESATSDNRGWDGTYGGKPQDLGVYNYYIKYRCLDGNIYEKKGDVTLIR